jgi:outer membrane protein assembly factor BamB
MAVAKKKPAAAKAVKAVKAGKGAKAPAKGAAAPKRKRAWLAPAIMAGILALVGGQIYFKARYLASLKFDMGRVGRIVPQGTDQGQSRSVLAVLADKEGHVFVHEDTPSEPRLQRFDANLSQDSIVYKAAKPDQKLDQTVDMDVSPEGEVFVLQKDGRVLVLSNDLKYLRTLKLGVHSPTAIAVNSTGRIYVASSEDNKVSFFDAEGKPEGEFGAPGTQTGDLVNPNRMRVTPEDEIVIIERTENGMRGKIFTAEHKLRKTFLVEKVQSCDPVKLGVTGDDKAFLNDHMGSRGVVAFDIKTGKFFGESQITMDGQKFVNPGALGASRFSNKVFVHSVVGLMQCYVPTEEQKAQAKEN